MDEEYDMTQLTINVDCADHQFSPVNHYNITFFDSENKECGRLDWNDGEMKFVGSADESAKAFFDAFKYLFDQNKG